MEQFWLQVVCTYTWWAKKYGCKNQLHLDFIMSFVQSVYGIFQITHSTFRQQLIQLNSFRSVTSSSNCHFSRLCSSRISQKLYFFWQHKFVVFWRLISMSVCIRITWKAHQISVTITKRNILINNIINTNKIGCRDVGRMCLLHLFFRYFSIVQKYEISNRVSRWTTLFWTFRYQLIWQTNSHGNRCQKVLLRKARNKE